MKEYIFPSEFNEFHKETLGNSVKRKKSEEDILRRRKNSRKVEGNKCNCSSSILFTINEQVSCPCSMESPNLLKNYFSTSKLLKSVIFLSLLFPIIISFTNVLLLTAVEASSSSPGGQTSGLHRSYVIYSQNNDLEHELDDNYPYEKEVANNKKKYKQQWSPEQLLSVPFNQNSSQDDDVHICKYINFNHGEPIDSEYLFEEDIFLSNKGNQHERHKEKDATATTSSRGKRAATARRERIWDFGVIPYEIDGNFSGAHKTLFKQAMRHWENSTCVKFVERTEDHPNYIVFTEKACGCCSFVGKRGNGPQAISIGKNCDKFGIVVHELGHAVGFWHEHTRPDRDDHVVIIRENIMTGQEYNFNKLTGDEVNSLGENYDFDSIMHYARNTFSRSTFLDTILPREDPNSRHRPEIGQRIRLSLGDIAQANRLYKCPKCGRTLLEPTGWFASPYHPSTYSNQSSSSQQSSGSSGSSGSADRSIGISSSHSNPPHPQALHGEKCEWRIVATHGETIVLNVTDFDLPYSDGCKHDYLEIRDGYWHKSKLLGRLCGPNLRFDRPIVSSGSRMVLTYSTTKSVESYRGFQAFYEAVCGGDLFGENGHLESPNFPDEYLASKECIWRITVPENYQVSLQFHSFEIENHENCVYDFLEIRDGLSANSTLLGTYCGYYPPAPLTSSSNQLWVRFISDGSVQKAGFSASYQKELDECTRGLHDCEHTCKNTIGSYTCGCKFGFELHSNGRECEDACGGIIEEVNGTLTSPSFPNLYPSNKHCAWEIIAPPQTRIMINFTHFDLEGNNQECDYDSVEVYSKLSQDELKRHGSFCGSRPPQMITSEGNSIRIVFTSDNSVQKTGFALIYFTDKDECATNNGGCAQICRNTVGSYICLCYNGFTLHANGHDCKEGGCKFDLTTPSQTNELSSPNYPEPYPGKKECIWMISTIQGHRVKLVFDELEVEQHPECTYDAVQIYDGSNSDMILLGKFCGSKIPPPVISSSNEMMILFKSDGSVHRRGFHARHYSVCGGTLFAGPTEEYIYSHANYGDSMYGDSEDCEWIIEMAEIDDETETDDLIVDHEEAWQNQRQQVNSHGPLDYVIELTFLSFEVEDENDCAFDFIEIFNGDDASVQSKSLGRYCGNRLPPPIRSEENGALLIRFKSDDTVSAKGFAAVYRTISSMEINNKGPPTKVPPPVPIHPQVSSNNTGGSVVTGSNPENHMINNDSQEIPSSTPTTKVRQGRTIAPTSSVVPTASVSSSSSVSVESSPEEIAPPPVSSIPSTASGSSSTSEEAIQQKLPMNTQRQARKQRLNKLPKL